MATPAVSNSSPAPRLAATAWTHPTSLAFVILGGLGVIGGGLLSAVIALAPSYHGSWAVAYIVLIVGVAQAVLGVAQASLTGGTVRPRTVAIEVVCWNLGNAGVLAGTLLGIVPLLYVGVVLLVAALAVLLYAIRHGRRGGVLITTRVIVVILLVSMPTGIVIQALTH